VHATEGRKRALAHGEPSGFILIGLHAASKQSRLHLTYLLH
jgi:hypothetical protein